jgi:hypothetical protein
MEPPRRSLADGVRHSCGGRKWTARELLRDQWFITEGPEILQEGEGATAGARQKHCPGRCCADAATACRKSWGCIEEDDGHISFSSGPHVVITAVPQERFGQGCMRSRRLQAHAGPDDRHWQTSCIPGIPGIACKLCIIHASSRYGLDVIAISAPAVRRLFIVSAARSRAVSRKLHHSHPSAIAADHSLRDSCHLRGPA